MTRRLRLFRHPAKNQRWFAWVATWTPLEPPRPPPLPHGCGVRPESPLECPRLDRWTGTGEPSNAGSDAAPRACCALLGRLCMTIESAAGWFCCAGSATPGPTPWHGRSRLSRSIGTGIQTVELPLRSHSQPRPSVDFSACGESKPPCWGSILTPFPRSFP